MSLLEITGDDIAQLGDADLRALVGLLCEADYRTAGLPTAGILWGGHQDAADGGLDVVVRSEKAPPVNSFIPRGVTGFQVKKPDMQPAKVRDEMRPNDVLRPEIQNLIQNNGAYIIVCSSGSTTDSALQNRINAMRDAVANEDNHENFYIDFMDRGRLATWVRSHPSMIVWVRNKVGRQIKGWRTYENWSGAPGGIKEEYITDDGLRLHNGTRPSDKGMSIEDGLLRLRSGLAVPGSSLRLAGLSGVGKTRLVQALFDERVGKQSLNPAQVFYTDISDGPEPDPITLANQLIGDKSRAILIVDNCPPDLHRRLTQACSTSQSTVSLLTVEYDVRDHLPDETEVFRLEPASEETIEKLIRKRFPHIGQVDANSIANFSGGNARVAIALANTVRQGETVSDFRDEELFERLFRQRNDANESLLISAEACSLVYSFEGKDATSEESELGFLGALVGKAGTDLFRDVKTLRDRDLVQSRDVWRAILPHAIANRLAKRALESIPKDTLLSAFLNQGTERLIKSFTRRLNYLHDCEAAVEIANEWLAKDGWVGKNTNNLNPFGMEIFRNLAPVSPEKALEAIENAASGEDGVNFISREANSQSHEFVRILRHLAYDPELFDRSLLLLCRFALAESPDENYNSTRDTIKSLFYIYLSGTHAPVEARAAVIERLVGSDDSIEVDLGLLLLDAALETSHFSSAHEFSFGARPRNYGYQPQSRDDIIHWYDAFIRIGTRLALSNKPVAEKAKKVLSNNLRGLWTRGGMFDLLEETSRQIHEQGAWNEGWIAVRGIIRFDKKGMPEDISKRLERLENFLRPSALLEQARTFALSAQHGSFDLEDDFDDEEEPISGWRRTQETTRRVGAQVAQNIEVFSELLPELVSTQNTRLNNFGAGLADGGNDKQALWQMLRTQFEQTPTDKQQIAIFLGFLSACAKSDQAFYNAKLDELVNDEVLGKWFPIFQTTGAIDARGVERLHEALELGKAPVHFYQYIGYGRSHEPISDDDLAVLLEDMLAKEDSADVVMEILKMRFHGSTENPREYSDRLMAVGRNLLATYPFPEERRRSHNNQDYELSHLAKICLTGDAGMDAALQMCQNLGDAITENRVYAFDYPGLLNDLARAQPRIFLDTFLGEDRLEKYHCRRMFSDDFERRENPLNQIPDQDLLSWCDEKPEERYPLMASSVQAFGISDKTGELEWKPLVYSIFETAPSLDAILENIADSLHPMAWSGSRADILEKRLILFLSLFRHENAEIQSWANSQHLQLKEAIKREREFESRTNRERNETFE